MRPAGRAIDMGFMTVRKEIAMTWYVGPTTSAVFRQSHDHPSRGLQPARTPAQAEACGSLRHFVALFVKRGTKRRCANTRRFEGGTAATLRSQLCLVTPYRARAFRSLPIREGRFTVAVLAMLCAAPLSAQTREQPKVNEPEKKEERLGERLIRQAATDSQEDMMAGIIRLMGDAERNLEIDFDPGDQTQDVQRRIVDRLDDAVKEAASQRRPRRSSGRPRGGDKRQMPKGQPDQGARTSGDAGDPGESTSRTPGGVAADRTPTDGDIHELRRTWGHLPMREREEIIQGIGESFLERYRDWIERYYRALQEAED